MKVIKNDKNRNVPGSTKLTGFWLKLLKSLHLRSVDQRKSFEIKWRMINNCKETSNLEGQGVEK